MLKELTLILVVLVGPVFTLLVLYLSKWQRKRSGKLPPFKDQLLRSPGERLRGEISDISDDVTAYLTIASTVPLVLYCSYLMANGKLSPYFFWTLGAAFAFYWAWKVLTLIKRRRDLRLGLAGEMAVGEELNRLMLDGCHVYHDFPADRFNIDHVLVGPSGVFAVETKARSKGSRGKRTDEAKVIYDGESLRFPSCTTREPVDQAKAQAAWLSKWLSGAVGDAVKAAPMVTIPGWYIERKSPNGVPVLNPKQVKTYLDGKKEAVLSDKMIGRICHQLEQKCRDVDLWEWY